MAEVPRQAPLCLPGCGAGHGNHLSRLPSALLPKPSAQRNRRTQATYPVADGGNSECSLNWLSGLLQPVCAPCPPFGRSRSSTVYPLHKAARFKTAQCSWCAAYSRNGCERPPQRIMSSVSALPIDRGAQALPHSVSIIDQIPSAVKGVGGTSGRRGGASASDCGQGAYGWMKLSGNRPYKKRARQ